MSNSVRPHRWQPTRLRCPWDSPGNNTGVGCHFLLQCMKVKSESEVAQSCPTLSDPMDCSPPGFSVHGIFQARVLEWGAIAFLAQEQQSPNTDLKECFEQIDCIISNIGLTTSLPSKFTQAVCWYMGNSEFTRPLLKYWRTEWCLKEVFVTLRDLDQKVLLCNNQNFPKAWVIFARSYILFLKTWLNK